MKTGSLSCIVQVLMLFGAQILMFPRALASVGGDRAD
jgi:hypothetical protein